MYWNFHDILLRSTSPRLVGNGTPLIVEIGFGNGEYLEHLAISRPGATIVGIEVSQWCLAKAARRVLAGELRNVRLLFGDARHLLKLAFAPGSVREIYMNFPCPWPKKRHAERRVARPEFADAIACSTRSGGLFTLATDVDWYAEETKAVFDGDPRFRSGEIISNPHREYLTKYERKWREMGRETYMLQVEKTGDAFEPDDREASAEEPEAFAPLRGNIAESLRAISGDVVQGRDYRVIFRETFSADDGTALTMVISVDEGFEQHYFLRFIPTEKGIRGKVDAVGHPYKTPGVRASLRYAMEKLGAKF